MEFDASNHQTMNSQRSTVPSNALILHPFANYRNDLTYNEVFELLYSKILLESSMHDEYQDKWTVAQSKNLFSFRPYKQKLPISNKTLSVDHLLRYIMDFMDGETLRSTCCVCHQWKAATEDEIRWQKLCQIQFGIIPHELNPRPVCSKQLYFYLQDAWRDVTHHEMLHQTINNASSIFQIPFDAAANMISNLGNLY